jgi:hypothetical protein
MATMWIHRERELSRPKESHGAFASQLRRRSSVHGKAPRVSSGAEKTKRRASCCKAHPKRKDAGGDKRQSHCEEDLPFRRKNPPSDSRRKDKVSHRREAREGDRAPISFVVFETASKSVSKGEETMSKRGHPAFAYFGSNYFDLRIRRGEGQHVVTDITTMVNS